MRSKIWGGIIAAMAAMGMASIATHFTGKLWEVALFVILALFAADGVATVAADCQGEEEE